MAADVTPLREAAALLTGFGGDVGRLADISAMANVDQRLVDDVASELTTSMTNARAAVDPTINRLWAGIGQRLAAAAVAAQTPPDTTTDPPPDTTGTDTPPDAGTTEPPTTP